MAGKLVAASGFGGHVFLGMLNGNGAPDLGVVNITVQGAQNDVVVTMLKIGAMIGAPDGTIAPAGWAIRWAITFGQDISQALFANIVNSYGPIGGAGGEGGVGSDAAFGPILTSGVTTRVAAQGICFGNSNDSVILWPDDANAPGALVIPKGQTGQLFVFGAISTASAPPISRFDAYLTIAGGPADWPVAPSGRGLPMQQYDERN